MFLEGKNYPLQVVSVANLRNIENYRLPHKTVITFAAFISKLFSQCEKEFVLKFSFIYIKSRKFSSSRGANACLF